MHNNLCFPLHLVITVPRSSRDLILIEILPSLIENTPFIIWHNSSHGKTGLLVVTISLDANQNDLESELST